MHEHAASQAGPSTLASSTSGIAHDEDDDPRKPLAPPLRLAKTNETLYGLPAHRFTNIGRYVPMNQYGEAHLLEDFEYLQHVGSSISLLGRDIVKRGWMRNSEQSQQQQQQQQPQQGQGQRKGAGTHITGHNKLSQEERNRLAFENWIRKMRLPIMLLPDGMSARKENHSRWKAQSRQLLATVELTFSCMHEATGTTSTASSQRTANGKHAGPLPSSRRTLLHHVSWDRKFSDVAWSELSKRARTFANDAGGSRDEALQKILFEALGDSALMSASSESPRTFFEQHACLLVAVHSDKLRNESSTRFLDWWQRQVRNGMVKEDGLHLDEDKRRALEEARQQHQWGANAGFAVAQMEGSENNHLQASRAPRVWGRPQAEKDGSDVAPQAAPTINAQEEQAEAVPEPMGLISASLLGRLQAARLASQAKSEHEQRQGQTESVSVEEETEVSKQQEDAQALAQVLRRSFIVLDGSETIEMVLRRLPRGNAVVEYPRVELWSRTRLRSLERAGQIHIEHLDPAQGAQDADGAPDGDGDSHGVQWKGGSMKRTLKDGHDEAALPPRKRAAHTADSNLLPIPQRSQGPAAPLAGISAYASSDEDEDDGENKGEKVHGEANADSAEARQRQQNEYEKGRLTESRLAARQELLGHADSDLGVRNAVEEGSGGSDDEGNEHSDTVARPSGLADIARALGMAPPEPLLPMPSSVESTSAAAADAINEAEELDYADA